MRTLQFNFNNEVDTFELLQDEETGRITVPGMNGAMAEYESIEQFAEMYAVARDVVPENLKNWTLLENGDVVSFVLRAGTAGVSAADIEEVLKETFDEIAAEGTFHPLEVMRVRQEVDGTGDVMRALAVSPTLDVARAVYDRLAEKGAFDVPEPEPEEVDERSEIEKYLDSVLEKDKSLAFFAVLVNGDKAAEKEEILEMLEASPIPYTADMLSNLYEDALDAAREGINVDTRLDAILVASQAVPGVPSDEAKAKIIAAANLAHRDKVNMTYYVVGHHHIRKTAVLTTILELNDMEVHMIGNIPVAVTFDPEVDAQLEAERDAEVTEEDAEDLTDWEEEEEDYDYEDDYDFTSDDDEF